MEYNDNEYIKLNRKIKNWEWYTDVNTAHFFVYCILTANWKDDNFHGMEVKRGQFIRTLENISRETGLSIQNIRTAVKHLISTQELTQNQHGKYRIFTIVKYEQYQLGNTISNNELTRNQHESNTKVTQSKEVKNIRTKEVKKDSLLNLSDDKFNCPSECQPDEQKTGAYDDLLKLWNSLEQYGIKPIRAISDQRLVLLKPRLKQYGRDSFAECVEQIKQSDFLQGKHNGRPWVITFDWLIKPSNYPKVLEGNYNNGKAKVSGDSKNQYLQEIIGML